MKKKWKILLVCAVVLAGIAAWCFVPRSAVGEDYKIHYVEAYFESEYHVANVTDQVDLETLGDLLRDAKRMGYHLGYEGWTGKQHVTILGMDQKGSVNILLDEGACLVDRGDFLGMYPLVNGEELLEQVWALLPEP